MRLAIGIVAVRDREANAEKMRARLDAQCAASGQAPSRIFYDDDRLGCWGNAKRVWKWGTEQPVDWVLVLQDDISFCADFVKAAVKIARCQALGNPVSFFLPRKSVEVARDRGLHYVATSNYLWAQATMIEVVAVRTMLSWVETKECADWNNDDDVRLAAFFKSKLQRKVLVTVPNLVEHLNMGSVMGHRFKYEGRRSRYYVGDAGLAEGLDWDRKDVVNE